jgi:hypothetical protein
MSAMRGRTKARAWGLRGAPPLRLKVWVKMSFHVWTRASTIRDASTDRGILMTKRARSDA